MKKLKSLLCALLVCVLALTVLAACGDDSSWEMDKDNHWMLNSSGEAVDTAAHLLVDDVCTICGAEVIRFDDGTWVQKYNEYGDITLWIIYDAEGNITQNSKNVYTYDEDGNWATQKSYEYGVLVSESIYATVVEEDGSCTYAAEVTTYNTDGTKLVEKHTADGSCTTETLYNADGSVQHEYTVTYEYNEYDLISSIKTADGETIVTEIRYEYDENGNSLVDRTYSYGTLVKEEFYTLISENFFTYGYISKIIEYAEDGTQTVTEYNEYGDVIG